MSIRDAERLAAGLAEDERIAQACQSPAPWQAATHEMDNWIVTDSTGEPVVYDEGTPTLEEAAHIARHDPARVLAEAAAKRRILALYEEFATLMDRQFETGLDPGRSGVYAGKRLLSEVVAALADAYEEAELADS